MEYMQYLGIATWTEPLQPLYQLYQATIASTATIAMAEVQNYNISVVSGGKPVLPRIADGITYGNTISNNKNISVLTHDQLHYIVPFNTQLKVYSLETRQCVKTIKFANNETLTSLFADASTFIVDILLNDITLDSAVPDDESKQKLITVITNKGHAVVLKYKGKLQETPKLIKLDGLQSNENVVKLFHSVESNQFKLLTAQLNNKTSSYHYKLYPIDFKSFKLDSKDCNDWNNVMLINWSNDNNTLSILHNKQGKQFTIASIFSQQFNVEIPFTSVFNDKHMAMSMKENSNSSSNNSTAPNQQTINKFVTSLAIDNSRTQLAIGFASGVITMVSIHDNIDLQHLDLRYLKWHIDSVLSLTFNHDGSYLISGGWEKVLNFWQLSTNQQQFLPRLNGIVIDSQVLDSQGKYYSITLQLTENNSNNDYQILLLNSIDLTSKISIMGPMPIFQQQLSNVIVPTSTQNLNSSNVSTIKKHLKKLNKSAKTSTSSTSVNFTTPIEIHPSTKQLYIPHGQSLQRFDFYKNESTNLQFLTDGVQMHMGKVRNELKNIMDPQVKMLKITSDGKWLITYEIEYPPKDILSSNDLIYVLKCWSQRTDNNNNSNQNKDGAWELKTKIMNPHGVNVPIVTMITGHNENSLLTADNNGGIKYWEFDQYQNNWCLKKILVSNFNHFNNSVALQWSRDKSLIFHAFDDKLQIIDFESFKLWTPPSESQISNEFNMDSQIQCLQLINETNLIIVTMTGLLVLDLLLGKIINGFDLYPYVNENFKNGHLNRLISCDEKNDKIVLVINQREDVDDKIAKITFKSHVLVFNSNLTHQLGNFTHDQYIAWIGWNHDTDFLFIDIDSKLGIVSTTMNTEIADEVNKEGILDGLTVGTDATHPTTSTTAHKDYLEELRKLAASKQKPLEQQDSATQNTNNLDDLDSEIINGERNTALINMNSFSNMFENIQNVSMSTLFDNVIKTLN